MRLILWLFGILAGAAAVRAGWSLWRRKAQDQGSLDALLAGLLTGGTLIAGVLVADQTFFTPFAPVARARPFVWVLSPPSPSPSVTIAFWVSVANGGAQPGRVEDLAVRVKLAAGDWVLEPLGFVEPAYYQSFFGRTFEYPPLEGPFSPFAVPARGEANKIVMFGAAIDPATVVEGQHPLTLYIRTGTGRFRAIERATLVLPADVVAGWRRGQKQQGQVDQRDTPTKNLLPPD